MRPWLVRVGFLIPAARRGAGAREFPIEAGMVLAGWWMWRTSLPPERRDAVLARALGPGLVALQAGFHLRHAWLPES